MTTENAQPESRPAITLGGALKKIVSPSAWVEYKEGISFHLRFMSKAKFRQLADDCTESRYNPQQQRREPKLDATKFTRLFLSQCLLDWRGVTLKSVSRIMEIDLSGYTPEECEQPLPFSAEEATKLIDMVYDLDSFLQAAITDIKTFRPTLEDELKNSERSQSGS